MYRSIVTIVMAALAYAGFLLAGTSMARRVAEWVAAYVANPTPRHVGALVIGSVGFVIWTIFWGSDRPRREFGSLQQ